MNEYKIKISEDFSDDPGARDRSDGPNSGQEFMEELLDPKFIKAVGNDGILIIDCDDVWGFPSSFVSGSFGRLSIKHGKEKCLKHLKFISNEDPLLIEKIIDEINDPLKAKKVKG